MKLSVSIVTLCLHFMLSGQTFLYQQVKDSAFTVLERQVGSELAEYFELAPKSMAINYENWMGKIRTKWIEPGETIKAKRLKVVSLHLNFIHPDLPSPDCNISFFIDFDNTLSSLDTFDLLKIPKFIRDGGPNDWLPQLDIHLIADTLTFEKKVQKIFTSLKYDNSLRKYFFE